MNAYEVYVAKLTSNGALQWTATAGDFAGSPEIGYSIVQANDSSYVVAGYTQSYGAGGGDIYLLKFDLSGNLLWQKTFGGSGFEGSFTINTLEPLCSLAKTKDGGYVIAGSTNSFGAGSFDAYVVKVDSAANLQWT